MNVLIVSQYIDFPYENGNARFCYIADVLVKAGHNVEIVTSDFVHTLKHHRGEKNIRKLSYSVSLLHEPGYKKNISFSRIFSHQYLAKSAKIYLSSLSYMPDVIYCAVPSLSLASIFAQFANKNNIKFIIDIQDLWPDAFRMVIDNKFLERFVYKFMDQRADYIYSSAYKICAVSKTYGERALKVNSKVSESIVVYLGTDISIFDRNKNNVQPYIKHIENEIWLGYCGTLGSSYDLRVVFDAIEILNKHEIKNIRFIIMGDGPKENEFKNYAKSKSVNTIFTGRLPYDIMCATLGQCDIAINPIVHNAAQSIINKHGDYAAVGIPVVSTQENEEYRNLVNQYNMGFNCKNGDAYDLAEKILFLITNVKLRKMMGRNARKCAEEKFDRKNSYKNLVNAIIN